MPSAPSGPLPPENRRPMRADARRNRARILRAAEEVFTAEGPGASTDEVARRAGVGIGTVFRHFPTKEHLLRAIVEAGVRRLADGAQRLLAEGDPGSAFFAFFSGMVEQAAARRSVVELLGGPAGEPAVAPAEEWRRAVSALLTRAQQAGAVRADAHADEVVALIMGTCQAAFSTDWEPEVRDRALAIVFDGLRPGR